MYVIGLNDANPHVASNRFTLTGSATTEDKRLFICVICVCRALMQEEYLFTDSGTFSTRDVIPNIHAKDIKRLWILQDKWQQYKYYRCLEDQA